MLDFTNTETTKVLKIIADFSGRGLVLPDSELGSILVYLKGIPWNEALYAITLSQNLEVELPDKMIIISEKKCGKLKY